MRTRKIRINFWTLHFVPARQYRIDFQAELCHKNPAKLFVGLCSMFVWVVSHWRLLRPLFPALLFLFIIKWIDSTIWDLIWNARAPHAAEVFHHQCGNFDVLFSKLKSFTFASKQSFGQYKCFNGKECPDKKGEWRQYQHANDRNIPIALLLNLQFGNILGSKSLARQYEHVLCVF